MHDNLLIILTPGFPTDENDSTCLPTQQLFVLTAKKLFPTLQIVVVTLQYPEKELSYRWNAIEVHPLNTKRFIGLARPIGWIRAYRALQKITQNNNVLGVLSFWCTEAALIGKYFTRRKSIAHKIWISGQDARKNNAFIKWINPAPHDLVAMSDFLQEEFFKNHSINPTHVITNAVQPSFKSIKKDIDVIGAGSLIPLKRWEVFIELISKLKKTNPAIKAVLLGTGPEEQRLKTQIKKLELSDTIALPGEVQHDTLIHWMNRSKVLLHTSEYEGYSTVCLEALACGCHVVSFTHAEDKAVPHWNVVANENEMIHVTSQILQGESNFTPVLLRDMETTVNSFISLFRNA